MHTYTFVCPGKETTRPDRTKCRAPSSKNTHWLMHKQLHALGRTRRSSLCRQWQALSPRAVVYIQMSSSRCPSACSSSLMTPYSRSSLTSGHYEHAHARAPVSTTPAISRHFTRHLADHAYLPVITITANNRLLSPILPSRLPCDAAVKVATITTTQSTRPFHTPESINLKYLLPPTPSAAATSI